MATKYEIARLTWDVLIDLALKKEKISYKELAYRIEYKFIPAIFCGLHEIKEYCSSNHLPPLTMIVVNKKGIQGKGFDDEIRKKYSFEDIYSWNWSVYHNPYLFTEHYKNIDDIAKQLVKEPSKISEIAMLIKSRGYQQQVFKKILLKVYGSKCAVCRSNIKEILEGCHIKAWSECNEFEKIDPRNGILLCANHHKLFDQQLMSFDSNGYIQFDEKVSSQFGGYFEELNYKYIGKQVELPKDKNLYPMFMNK